MLSFFREGISFLWGIAKNYIMYWGGVTSIIIACEVKFGYSQILQISQFGILVFVYF